MSDSVSCWNRAIGRPADPQSMLLSVVSQTCLLALLSATAAATKYRIWCYTGLKYVIGQEERQDAEECTSMFGLDNYCYRFTVNAGPEEVVKLGCSNMICSGLRNRCEHTEFAGAKGVLCCCNQSSYCNSAVSRHVYSALPLALSALSLRLFLTVS